MARAILPPVEDGGAGDERERGKTAPGRGKSETVNCMILPVPAVDFNQNKLFNFLAATLWVGCGNFKRMQFGMANSARVSLLNDCIECRGLEIELSRRLGSDNVVRRNFERGDVAIRAVTFCE